MVLLFKNVDLFFSFKQKIQKKLVAHPTGIAFLRSLSLSLMRLGFPLFGYIVCFFGQKLDKYGNVFAKEVILGFIFWISFYVCL